MFKALFSAKGRMRRRDWWLWTIASSLVFGLMSLLLHTWFGTSTLPNDMAALGKTAPTPFHLWIIVINTIGYWPTVCLTAKRWHDRNRSGWLAAAWPILGMPIFALEHFSSLADGFSLQFAVGAARAVLGIASLIYVIWVLIDCGILDGTKGPNKYGACAKGLGAQVEDVF